MTHDDGRTEEYRGIQFRTVGKGIRHCQTCLRITYNYVSHATWHATGVGDIGWPAISPLEPTQPEAEALASVPVYARGGDVSARPTHEVRRGDDTTPCWCAATSDHVIGREVTPDPAAARGGDEQIEMACAWSDFRKDYGVSGDAAARAREHQAFMAGWLAASGRLDTGGPLR